MPQRIVQYGASRAQTAGYQLTSNPATLYRIDGYCTGSANSYLQLFDATSAPSTNDVPVKSLLVVNTNGYSYTFLKEDMVSFTNGIYVALSTNETKYVADASGTKVSGDMTIEELGINIGATATSATDLFGTGTLSVWDATAGPKNLTQINFTNGAAAATKRWLVICATNASDAVVGKVMFFYPLFTTANGDGTGAVTNRSSGILKFGDMFDNKGLPVSGVIKTTGAPAIGCLLVLTDTANPASVDPNTLSVVTGDHTIITAYYQ